MHQHSHLAADTPAPRLGALARAVLLVIVLGALAATVLGLIRLWPSRHTELPGGADTSFSAPGVTFPKASVESVAAFACPTGADDSGDGSDTGSPGGPATSTTEATCAHIHVRLLEGAGKGTSTVVDVAPAITQSGLSRGDTIQVLRVPPGEGQPANYSYYDTSRGLPLLLLTIIFAIIVIGVARLKGLLSLIGIGVAGATLIVFALPALLQNEPALLVGLVAASSIMFVVLYLAHGISWRTSTALVGTMIGLLLTAGIGAAAVTGTRLSGLTEESQTLSAFAGSINLQHLLTCGIIIAGLGVLNDVTITQSSAVWELRANAPAMSRRDLFLSGMRIGRDHIASTVYTIVFAYAGVALPLLLLIEIYQRPLLQVLVSADIAEEIVRTLASAIALVVAVPVTTALAVLVIGHSDVASAETRTQGR